MFYYVFILSMVLSVIAGLAENIGVKFPKWIVIIVALLVIINNCHYMYCNYSTIIQTGAGLWSNFLSIGKFLACVVFTIEAIAIIFTTSIKK